MLHVYCVHVCRAFTIFNLDDVAIVVYAESEDRTSEAEDPASANNDSTTSCPQLMTPATLNRITEPHTLQGPDLGVKT